MKLQLECFSKDANQLTIIDDAGKSTTIVDSDYLPRDMGIGGGDQLTITIDVATGTIIGWDPTMVTAAIQERLNEQCDSD